MSELGKLPLLWHPLDYSPRSWREDYFHENGRYLCHCIGCGESFFGYKRRHVCKECARVAGNVGFTPIKEETP
jgi:hypothetical protein